MDQAASDYVLAVRVRHAASIIMTHAVGSNMAGLPPSTSVRFGPAFVPIERYYTEHVQISSNEGADNRLLRANARREATVGWSLVSMTRDLSGDSVQLVWNNIGSHRELGPTRSRSVLGRPPDTGSH
jgi:hypothetical protein